MRLTYKHLKKIHSDDNCTTLQHADGHTIKIAHRGLSKEMREKLDKVPGFYSGAVVDADTKESEPEEPGIMDAMASNEAAMAQVNPAAQAPAGFEQAAQPSLTQTPQPAKDAENAPLPPGPEAAGQPQTPALDLSGQKMHEQGLRAEAKELGALGKTEAGLAAKHASDLQRIADDTHSKYTALEGERQAVLKDIREGRIDPNRIWSRTSDLGKVSTAVGLILGGIGAGTRGENMALNFLNKQIDRDIEGQKADMAQKNNLLKGIMEQFGNLKDTTTMAKIMYTDIYTAKLQEAAAKSKDPMAQARAQQAIGALRAQTAPLQAELAQRQAALEGVKTGKIAPASAVNSLVPKEQRDTAFKEIAAVENAQKAAKSMEDLANRAKQLQSTKSRLGSPLQSKAELEALKVEVMGALKPIFGTLSESDKKQVEGATINFTDSPATIERKMKVLQNLATKGMTSTPVLDAAGIKIKKPDDTPSKKKNPNVRD